MWIRTELCDSGIYGIHQWDSSILTLVCCWTLRQLEPFHLPPLCLWSQDRALIKSSEKQTVQNEKKPRGSIKKLETLAICIIPGIKYTFLEVKRACNWCSWCLVQSIPSSVPWCYPMIISWLWAKVIDGRTWANRVLTPWKSIGLSERQGRSRGLCLPLSPFLVSWDVTCHMMWLHFSPNFPPQNDPIWPGKPIGFP